MIRHFLFITFLSFIIACITSAVISPQIWYENAISILAHTFQKTDWYNESKSQRLAYNKALSLAKNGDFDTAQKIVSSISSLEKNRFSRDLLELRGDIAYSQKTNTGQIIAYYDRSLDIAPNSRVSYKKSLILDSQKNKRQQSSNSPSPEQKTKKNSLKSIQKNRSKYLDARSSNLGYQKEEIDRIKRALDESNYTPIKDW